MSDLVLVNKVPVPRGVRVNWSRFKERRGDTESERTVDDVAAEGEEGVVSSIGSKTIHFHRPFALTYDQ